MMESPSPHSDRFELRGTRIEDYEGIRQLCETVYPFSQPWGEDQIRSHLEVFPEGQLVIWDHEDHRLVGMAASLIVNWDDYELADSWQDFTDSGYFRNHDPQHGRTLYAAEVMIHPDCRGKGAGRRLYAARRAIAESWNLLRIRAGARMRGYSEYASELSPYDYMRAVVRGQIADTTLTFQLRQGFRVVAVVKNYLPGDPESGGWAAVIEWLNDNVATEADRTAQVTRYARLLEVSEAEARALMDFA